MQRFTRISTVALLLTASGWAVGLHGRAHAGPGPCVAGPVGTVTCTGDHSAGIRSGIIGFDFQTPATTTLFVNGLTRDIAPAGGEAGISFYSTSDIAIETAASNFSIVTVGPDSAGIVANADQPGGAGSVSVVNRMNISTNGTNSQAIYASARDDRPVLVDNSGVLVTQLAESGGIEAYAGGNGTLVLRNTGGVTTSGTDSFGLSGSTRHGDLALTNSGTVTTHGVDAVGIVARSGSGEVTLTNSGDVTTHAQGAIGIGAGSDSSPITVRNSGTIATSGARAHGIVGASFGPGGDVEIETTGDVSADGPDASGILAVAESGSTSIDVQSGTSVRASGTAIWFAGGTLDLAGNIFAYDAAGSNNVLENYGTISGTYAVRGDAGNDAIDNHGVMQGSIDLGAGTNAFVNNVVFLAGPVVNVGTGNNVTNNSTMYVGTSIGQLATTDVTGNFVQAPSGTLVVDVDPLTGQADRLNVSGTATLAGRLQLNQLNMGPVPGTQQITVIEATGGIVDNGIVLTNTGAVDYELIFPDPGSAALYIAISMTTDFAPDGMNRNQTALGENINAIQSDGGSLAFAPVVTALAALPDVASLAAAYDVLSPDLYLKTEIATLFSSLSFANSLMSCRVRDGGHAIVREGQCVWAEASGRFLDQDRTAASPGFNEDAWRFSGGAQFAIAPGTHLNMAAGYETGSISSLQATSDVDRAMAGVALKHQSGPLLLSAALHGGYAWHDDSRNLAFPGFAGVATAEHDVSYVAGRLGAAWLHDMGGWYVKPKAALDVTHLRLGGTRETGGGGAALAIEGDTTTVVSVSPAIEFGGESRTAGGMAFRPYLSLGLTAFSDDEFSMSSSFIAGPAGAGGFTTVTEIDRIMADVSAGLVVLDQSGMTLKLGYDGRFGDTVREHAVGAKATFPF